MEYQLVLTDARVPVAYTTGGKVNLRLISSTMSYKQQLGCARTSLITLPALNNITVDARRLIAHFDSGKGLAVYHLKISAVSAVYGTRSGTDCAYDSPWTISTTIGPSTLARSECLAPHSLFPFVIVCADIRSPGFSCVARESWTVTDGLHISLVHLKCMQ